jgi:thiol:disulfide interchange protein DsbD
MQLLRGFGLVLLAASMACGQAQTQFGVPGARLFGSKKHTRVRLVLSHEAAKPGDTITAGIELTMDPGWHTYWKNPGDSGQETEMHWNLPAGISAGEIQWPTPEKFTTTDKLQLTTYVYHEHAILLVPLKIPANAPAGEHDLAALVKWLECEVACIPGSNIVRGTLIITNETKLNGDTNFFAEAQKRLPSKQVPGNATAKWDAPGTVTNRAFTIEWTTDATEPDFFPFINSVATIGNKTKVVANSAGKVVLGKTAERTGSAWPKEISGLLVRKENGGLHAYETTLQMPDTSPSPFAKAGSKSLLGWLLYAFIGGLILNVMPCVLPVIALKILGFVSQSQEHPRRVRALGLLYTLGVLASFLVLAGITIGLKAAGQKVGWGMQLSNPQFIIVLTVVVTLVALNLFGVFEITLSGGAMNAAASASSGHGSSGAFMNGVLATALATPCVAPFLGGAVGFALAQPSHIIALFFATIGLGMALPYLFLCWNPAWLKFLPKPGAWMERFKVAMGFPMLATAVWLVTLTTDFYGDRVLWLGIFLVIVALAAWVYGAFVQRGRTRRAVSLAVVLLLLGGGFVFAVEKKLHWRQPIEDTGNSEESEPLKDAPEGIAWKRWSAAAVANAQSQGRPIIVDFTAKWCLTCNTIVKPALESDAVQAKIKEVNAVLLLANWTKRPPVITAELEKFERGGVPMILVYPKDPAKPVMIFDTITPGTIVKALDEAVK